MAVASERAVKVPVVSPAAVRVKATALRSPVAPAPVRRREPYWDEIERAVERVTRCLPCDEATARELIYRNPALAIGR